MIMEYLTLAVLLTISGASTIISQGPSPSMRALVTHVKNIPISPRQAELICSRPRGPSDPSGDQIASTLTTALGRACDAEWQSVETSGPNTIKSYRFNAFDFEVSYPTGTSGPNCTEAYTSIVSTCIKKAPSPGYWGGWTLLETFNFSLTHSTNLTKPLMSSPNTNGTIITSTTARIPLGSGFRTSRSYIPGVSFNSTHRSTGTLSSHSSGALATGTSRTFGTNHFNVSTTIRSSLHTSRLSTSTKNATSTLPLRRAQYPAQQCLE